MESPYCAPTGWRHQTTRCSPMLQAPSDVGPFGLAGGSNWSGRRHTETFPLHRRNSYQSWCLCSVGPGLAWQGGSRSLRQRGSGGGSKFGLQQGYSVNTPHLMSVFCPRRVGNFSVCEPHTRSIEYDGGCNFAE